MIETDLTAIAAPIKIDAVRIGYLRAALQRLRDGEFRSPQVMADVARAALQLDDTLAP